MKSKTTVALKKVHFFQPFSILHPTQSQPTHHDIPFSFSFPFPLQNNLTEFAASLMSGD